MTMPATRTLVLIEAGILLVASSPVLLHASCSFTFSLLPLRGLAACFFLFIPWGNVVQTNPRHSNLIAADSEWLPSRVSA